jgi:alpha-tubulin suppressor-like RCC1 family protein
VFGQLGMGTIEDHFAPRINTFFNDKTIQQISLGYAHTLVLCREDQNSAASTLYVFGSNHYGQLGVGQDTESEMTNDKKESTPQFHRKTFVKSLVPIIVKFDESIRLINTGYFANVGGYGGIHGVFF